MPFTPSKSSVHNPVIKDYGERYCYDDSDYQIPRFHINILRDKTIIMYENNSTDTIAMMVR